jgi:glycosyltransferase involved in cell wall biosynthesis
LSLAYLTPGWPPDRIANGIVMYIDEITRGLGALGHSTTLLTTVLAGDAGRPGVYDLREFDGRRSLPVRLRDRLASRLSPTRGRDRGAVRAIVAAARRAIAERGVGLLEMEESFGWPAPVRRRLPIPTVVRLHGPWFLNGAMGEVVEDAAFRERVRNEGEAIRRADGVSASSRDVLERTRAYYGLPLERAEVIHPPAPTVPDRACWRLDDCDRRTILFVGRFDRHKGADLVIEAFARLAGSFPEARLLFAGPDRGLKDDGGRVWSIGEFLRERVADPDARGRIEYLGALPIPRVMELRRRALASVVGSRYDNFPTTVTEAMAMGCPVVAPATGGIREQIADGESGLLCAPGDAGDLAAKVGRLLADPALAARLGDRARRDSAATLSVAAISARMAAFYRRVLDESPRTTPHPARRLDQ